VATELSRERVERWLASGGSVQVVQLADAWATVELRTCTNELMECWPVHDQALLDHLRRCDGVESAHLSVQPG
jgi:hypothetical protein